jgi:hypothetical protein
MRIGRLPRAAAWLAVLAALGAAAGCAQEAGGDLTAAWEASPVPDDRTPAERRVDEAAARRMLLTIDDLGGGWRAGPGDDGEDEADRLIQAKVADCLGVSRDVFDTDNPRATSPTFATVGDDQEVSVAVAFTPSSASAERTIALFRRDDAPGCFQEAFRAAVAAVEVPPGVEVSDPELERLAVGDLGDGAVAFRVSGTISAPGGRRDIYSDVLYVRVGRIGITAMFDAVSQPFDTSEAVRLTRLVVDRSPE